MHVFSRIVMGDVEMPRLTKAFQRAKEIIPAVRATPKDHPILRLAYRLVRARMEPVSYTHLDVYKRQGVEH